MSVFGMITTASSANYTDLALRTLYACTPTELISKLVLIDNDGQYAAQRSGLKDLYPNLEILVNPEPLSFAANMNKALTAARQSNLDLYFLNNDLVLTEGWIEPLLTDNNSLLSPLSNREVHYALSIIAVGSQHPASVFMTDMFMDMGTYLENQSLFTAMADVHRRKNVGHWPVYVFPFFCVKVPLLINKTLGNVDESYGKGGGEDYDYCLRAHLAGFSVKYALGSYILHFGGKSFSRGDEAKIEQLEREAKFKKAFEDKWGSSVYQLIMEEKAEIANNTSGVRELTRSGQITEAIKLLIGDRKIELTI